MTEAAGNRGWIGRTLEGRYEVLDVIGEGGMGAVFKARHLLLDKEVALKVVLPGLANNQELSARFAREAAVTSRLDHPNVISVSDSGLLDDGSAYIAMQLVRGPSLTHVLETQGALPWPRVVSIGAQLSDALSAARVHGIVHRDLKPDNILLQQLQGGRELVKVLDFGIARFTRESLAPPAMRGEMNNLTQTGLVVGTPGYMSPEQSLGEPADYRSDLYALGVILWECLSGQRLWIGEDVPSVVEKQLTTTPPDVRQMVEGEIPDALAAIVMQLLSRRANDRPQDPAVVKEVLSSLGSDLSAPLSFDTGTQLRAPGSSAFHAPASRHSVEGMPTVLDTPPRQNPRDESAPRRRTLRPRGRSMALFALLLVTVLGALGVLVYTGVIEVRPTEQFQRVADDLGVNLPPSLRSDSYQGSPAEQALAADERTAEQAELLGVPKKLVPEVVALMGADTRTDRVQSARALLSHVPMDEVDPYVRAVAQLQIGETCAAKAERLDAIRAVGDPRALPALHYLASRPRSGCGKKGNRDCIGCLRGRLERLITDLESSPLD